jgi:hypothetical protein
MTGDVIECAKGVSTILKLSGSIVKRA